METVPVAGLGMLLVLTDGWTDVEHMTAVLSVLKIGAAEGAPRPCLPGLYLMKKSLD